MTIRGYADFAALLWGISAHEAGVLRNRAVENSGFWAEIPVHRDLGQMASELLLLMLLLLLLLLLPLLLFLLLLLRLLLLLLLLVLLLLLLLLLPLLRLL